MTVLYPRERVKEVLKPLSLAAAYRIVLKPYLSDPLTARPSKSRFCDGRTYAVLYAAGDFATAFAEVVVRDRLPTNTGDSESHPKLPEVLRLHRVRIEP